MSTRDLDAKEQRRRPRPAAPVPALAPEQPTHARILALQRTAGNRVVAQVIAQSHPPPAHDATPQTPGRRLMRVYAYTDEPLTRVVTTGDLTPPVTWTGRRPKIVTGPAKGLHVPERGKTATPLAYKQASGLAQIVNLLRGFDGGHVVGLHLGGENVSANVVPMFPGFNRGVWKNMEDETKKYVFEHPGQHRITVTMDYTTSVHPEVPKTFTVTREVLDPIDGWKAAFPQVVRTQPDDIEVTQRLSLAEEAIVRGEQPIAPMTQFIFSSGDFDTGKHTFRDYVNKKGHMPPSLKAHYPDSPAHRPYELLDILSLNGTITLRSLTVARGDFGGDQRALIIQTNKARNGGLIKSDDPNDPHPYLDERGTTDAPEVDHIVPKSRGGSNYYSNARLVSWQLNNREDRVKSLKGLVDLGRLALPTLLPSYEGKAVTIVEQAIARDKLETPISPMDIAAWAVMTFTSLSHSPSVKLKLAEHIEAELGKLVVAGEVTTAGDGLYSA